MDIFIFARKWEGGVEALPALPRCGPCIIGRSCILVISAS